MSDQGQTTYDNGSAAAAGAGDLMQRARTCADNMRAARKEVDKLTERLRAARAAYLAAEQQGDDLIVAAVDVDRPTAQYVRAMVNDARRRPASRR